MGLDEELESMEEGVETEAEAAEEESNLEIEEGADDEFEDDDADEFEEVELELDEDDIVSYLVDEEGAEIGFTLLDEEGNEVEYFYVNESEAEDDNEFDLGITKEGVAQATTDINAIYKDGVAVASELKGAFDDIMGAFDFKSVLKK